MDTVSSHNKEFFIADFLNRHVSNWENTVAEYQKNPDAFIRKFNIIINGKIRTIITYKNSDEGYQLRLLHKMFTYIVSTYHRPANVSYAYKKNSNITKCVKRHIKSRHFLKTDIHAFFGSINFNILLEKFTTINKKALSKEIAARILSACFYKGEMPIGFITSPLLSDIFLKDIDRYFSTNKNIIYTRYADDFIISLKNCESISVLTDVLQELSDKLSERHLELNTRKTYIRTLSAPGDAIHILGLNLVADKGVKCRITVSDRYLRSVSLELAELSLEIPALNREDAEKSFNAWYGKLLFIKNSSKSSFAKLEKIIKIKIDAEIELTEKSLKKYLNLQ